MSVLESAAGPRPNSAAVNRAVRVLAAGCADHRRELPHVGALRLGPETVSLLLTTPDTAPTPGWDAENQGRTWRTTLPTLGTALLDERTPFPFPLLVSLGMIGEERLLLNLAEAGGVISVGGDAELALGLVAAWSRRLTTGPWSAGIRIVRVGFDPDPGFAGFAVTRLAEAAHLLGDHEGGIVFFAEPPNGEDLHLTDQLRADPARRWTLVVAGTEDAAWRLTVGIDGHIDTGLLAEPVRLRS